MEIALKYGTGGLVVDLPDTPGFQGVLAPDEPPAVPDPAGAVARALGAPTAGPALAEIAPGRGSACVVISDITRPVPNDVLLPPILDTLDRAGVPRDRTVILVATGMHRRSTQEEHRGLVGDAVWGRCPVVDHVARDPDDTVDVGRIAGDVPVRINRRYLDADLKILTGFIEPHMWAGYSGGRKALLPGLSGAETLEYMHGPAMVAHPATRYGVLDGNPFHEAGLEVLALAGADFVVNVTLDTDKRITGVFAGHPVDAHLEGCAFLARHCVREVDGPLDFVVTTNAGAPLDCNLYQTVKGITGAAPVVRTGGDIVVASRCAEGVGSPEYRRLLETVDTPRGFLDRLMAGTFFVPDQWCAQETYQVVADHPVWVHTDGIEPEELERYHLRPAPDLPATVRALLDRHGPAARWAVVPDGPLVILRLAGG